MNTRSLHDALPISGLCNVNSDSEAKRSGNVTLNPPLVRVLPAGAFYEWMRSRGKLGGQNKVPRLANTREYVEQLLIGKSEVNN
jgi:hypothetical protein